MLFQSTKSFIYNGTQDEFIDGIKELYPLGIPAVTYNLLGGVTKDNHFEIVNQKMTGWSGLGEVALLTGATKQISDDATLIKIKCRSGFSINMFTLLFFGISLLLVINIATSQKTIGFLLFTSACCLGTFVFSLQARKSLMNRFVTCFDLKPSY